MQKVCNKALTLQAAVIRSSPERSHEASRQPMHCHANGLVMGTLYIVVGSISHFMMIHSENEEFEMDRFAAASNGRQKS